MWNNNYHSASSNRLPEMQDENDSNAEASVQGSLQKQMFWRFLQTPGEHLECSILLKLLKKDYFRRFANLKSKLIFQLYFHKMQHGYDL